MEARLTSYDKTVKSIYGDKYHISLKETPKGRYYIEYGRFSDKIKHSHDVVDYNLAATLFQRMLLELEGN